MNKDEQEVAAEEAKDAMDEATQEAEEDAQHAIADVGKHALRGVQANNNAAVDGAVGNLKGMSEEEEARMAAELEAKLHASEAESAAATDAANAAAKKGILDEGDRAMSKYISDAKKSIKTLVGKMKVDGEKMVAELHTTITNSKQSNTMIDKMVIKAEDDAHYAVHFMDEPEAEKQKAQAAAKKAELDVRTGVIGTKLSTQATQDAITQARNAADAAMSAKIGSNFIHGKVMKTKAGITTATAEVSEALIKAENAKLEAQAAVFQAKKAKQMMGK